MGWKTGPYTLLVILFLGLPYLFDLAYADEELELLLVGAMCSDAQEADPSDSDSESQLTSDQQGGAGSRGPICLPPFLQLAHQSAFIKAHQSVVSLSSLATRHRFV